MVGPSWICYKLQSIGFSIEERFSIFCCIYYNIKGKKKLQLLTLHDESTSRSKHVYLGVNQLIFPVKDKFSFSAPV